MAKRIRISLVAPRSSTQDLGLGQKAVDAMISSWRQRLDQVLPDRPDLIVLPECCDLPFGCASPDQLREYCQARGDQVFDFFADVARQHRTWIAYATLRLMPDGSRRNSIHLIDRMGDTTATYNKNFPTIGEMESGINAGRQAQVFECELGRVACAICFDLNFDELRLRYAEQKPDLVIFSSVYHGGLMQNYWAYSCRAHLVSAVTGLPSHVINPVGTILASTTNYHDHVTTTVNLDCQVVHLDSHWEKLRALKQKYGPQVSIFDPGCLAPVLISSESDERNMAELMAEFEFEPIDDYLNRARRVQEQHLEPPGSTTAQTAPGGAGDAL